MKILVQCMAGIGDTLLASPLFSEINQAHPAAEIDALVMYPGSVDVLKNHPDISRIIQINLLKENPVSILKKLLELRFSRYDITICAHPQSRTAYRGIAMIIGSPIRASHIYEASGLMDRFLVTATLDQDYTLHTVENNRNLLAKLGLSCPGFVPRLHLFFTPAEEAYADAVELKLNPARNKWIGVHVGSGSTKNLILKRWPLERWCEFFERVGENKHNRVLLFGGPEEKAAHDLLLHRFPELCQVAPTRNLREVGALMKKCQAFVSVDTALMHIAAAVEVSGQVVIEGVTLNPTNLPFRKTPYVVAKNPMIKNRYLDFYRYDGHSIRATDEEMHRIMSGVTAEQVFRLLPS